MRLSGNAGTLIRGNRAGERWPQPRVSRRSRGRCRMLVICFMSTPACDAWSNDPRGSFATRHGYERLDYTNLTPNPITAFIAVAEFHLTYPPRVHPGRSTACAPEATKVLTSLAVDGQVAASTQNQASSTLLHKDMGEVDFSRSTTSCARRAPGAPRRSHACGGSRHAPLARRRAASPGLPARRCRTSGRRVRPAPFAMPARRTAAFTTRWSTDSWRWWSHPGIGRRR
jgi:hypothetical protein